MIAAAENQMTNLVSIITSTNERHHRNNREKYAVTTEIEKAFLQIQLHENDRDATRVFWFDDPN